MNLLITGGMGHIGSKLINKLSSLDKIKKIIIIDNFSSERYISFINLKNRKKIIFFDEDLAHFNLNKIKNKIDCIIHLASTTNAEKSFLNRKKVMDNNVEITNKILALRNKNTKIIFASSTSVYGSQYKIINSKNNQLNISPQSPYAESKILCENIIKKKSENYCIMRFGTIFGMSDGMRFHTAINKFCYQAAMDKEITIWKKFYKKKRPYLDLDDCVRSIIFSIFNQKIKNETLDVVTINLKVSDIIKEIEKLKKINKSFVNTKILNQLSYEVHSDRLINLKFKFNGNLFSSIKKTINKLNLG
jgi:nucleoside-diphosphate-sugar epimerase